MPRQGFMFVFEQPGASGTVVPTRGARRTLSNADEKTRLLPIDPALHDAWMELSAAPKALAPMLEPPAGGKG